MSEHSAKMWSGRFREPLNADFEEWQCSFLFDYRLLEVEIRASDAHARMLEAAGLLTSEEADRMVAGLRSLADLGLNKQSLHDPNAAFAASAAQAEDIHHFVELELTRKIGMLALKLHTGRSRNEQIATDMRLYVSDTINHLCDGLHRWCVALLGLAESAGEHVMPSYTHLQRAEPVLVAHWLLSYVSMLERDRSRLRDCQDRLSVCPLGSGAVAGATLKLDRSVASRALGMREPTLNSMDATSDRDFALEFTQALSVFGIHVSRFAEELTLFSTTEFGFLDLPEAFSTGSSAMPQKKNPDLTELLRAKSATLIGSATSLTVLLKGLPLAYNKDLQEGQIHVFQAAETALGILDVVPQFTKVLTFRYDLMQAAAESGYLNAMAAATYLANKGVPFRQAHEIIGNAVRLGLATQRELGSISLDELQSLSPVFAEDFFSAISLEATLDCHDVLGGTARHRVAAALVAVRARIESDASHVTREE